MWCERKLCREERIVCCGGEKEDVCRGEGQGERELSSGEGRERVVSDGIAVGEERAYRGERKLSSRGGEVFVGMKRMEVAGEDGVCRIGRGNCGRVKGEFAEVMRGGVVRRAVEEKRELLK